ncbi:LrgB family protein [Pseudoalteromonas sp. MMG022]|uniref:LrgB family protein n=1 Tax=Pseudoalteromonas sp. MMG022 TaxID=2909978 RepID=UPI001F2BCD01|nr:LrgB family protein [Pseudoalteromonas sp. MMG022]MCF6435812.1 LrgB family protein [Pseudoalteromonas sp. MMG022]
MINSLLTCALVGALYLLFRTLHTKYQTPTLNPLLLCIMVISAWLLTFEVNYQTFFQATQPIHFFLEVAVVALAYPLYTQFGSIKQHFVPLVACSFIGVTCATLVAFILCQLYSADDQLSASLAALSVTTPITLLISESLGGMSAIAAIMVILVGIFGGIFGVAILTRLNIMQPQAKGIALGVSCHAIGTASALEYHHAAGAYASAAMTVSAVVTAIWVPPLYHWLITLS